MVDDESRLSSIASISRDVHSPTILRSANFIRSNFRKADLSLKLSESSPFDERFALSFSNRFFCEVTL